VMSVITETCAPALTLSRADAAEVERVARELCSGPHQQVDDPGWVAAARDAAHFLPVTLRRTLRQFRRSSGARGTLLLRGLPVDEEALAQTPAVEGSVQRSVCVPAAVLLMTACTLGDPVAFRAEKSGALVQDVVPVPGKEDFQGNAGSVMLSFHNENAFHQHRPDYVMLLCLRPDHDRVAGVRTACVREIMPLLSEEARETLFSAEFTTNAPPSFGPAGGTTPPHAVFFGAPDDPNMLVDLAATAPMTARAKDALIELQDAFDRTAQNMVLVPGDLVIVDNHVTVHGRTAFQPRYDGWDRWLQRTFVARDLRRSRDHRPQDGYVLAR
jgi:L-asparagine oxygenase